MSQPNRRSILKHSAFLALATASANSVKALTQTQESPKCPIGFGSYGLPNTTAIQAIERVAAVGFDSIELAAMQGYHAAPDVLRPNDRDALRSCLAKHDLRLGALMGLPNPAANQHASQNAWVQRLLDLAIDLCPEQPPLIQSVLGGGNWEDKKTLFCDALGAWSELANQANVRLAIKPHRGHAMSLPEHAIWLFEQLGNPSSLCMVYDPSHFAFRGLTLSDTVAESLPYTGYIVLKDAVQENGTVRFALPGEAGTIPHAAIIKQFLEGGYDGEVCCEVSSQLWRQDNYKPDQAIQVCFDNLTSIVNGPS
ncbi:sugar phosphate isomerase/epimerase family protein [Rhodopirellula sp. MGV]|uniref:sugar phosphate isomerase/epimerase family protein n=1 Tax=Rhodopirellula sp. MGV TaxID=2023130 RepID=UPI000B975FA8|nr:TIM barrel protein [Rhodopirellula sp. MGV]OYP31052.1 hypothetical protein CGZ80_22040 [Rhodopirellula sp. MGV]PNY34601.1 sugar phosphate isomerase/epimerase [Rhodopirellula baltica]